MDDGALLFVALSLAVVADMADASYINQKSYSKKHQKKQNRSSGFKHTTTNSIPQEYEWKIAATIGSYITTIEKPHAHRELTPESFDLEPLHMESA